MLSTRLRELREKKGLSAKQLSLEFKKSINWISNFENEISKPKLDDAILLANFFNVTLDYLVGNEKEEKILISKTKIKKLNEQEKIKILIAILEIFEKES